MMRPSFRPALLTLMILILFGCGFLSAGHAASPMGLPIWTPGDPDPTIPFSDRYPVAIIVPTEAEARGIVASGIDVESVLPADGGWLIQANINDDVRSALIQEGREVHRLRNLALEAFHAHPPGRDPAAWPTFEQLQSELQSIAASHPNICRLVSIGRSVQGRDIWFMKITDNPDLEEDEPEFKYSSSMHGDEVTGMEMCRRLINLLTDSYGIDPTLTSYVNGIEIWICPLHNPDGYVSGSRYNAHGTDLNRDFPDPITDPVDDPAGREPETQAFMYLGYDHRFILSANYHGGALVVNYPWDSREAYTPDDTMIRNFSLGYSYRNPPMWNSPYFTHGVTIGWAWYIVNGGMQDWCYEWRGDIDVTIEVSETKWPNWSTMDQFWQENRDAMLYYMSRTLIGIRGIVTDGSTGLPVPATVDVAQIGKTIRTDPEVGDYHRMLEPGTYTLKVEAFGYETQTIPGIVVVDGPASRRDVVLNRLPTYQVSGTVKEEETGAPLEATVEARRYDTSELVGQTTTQPGTGAYALSLMSYTYDLRVSAAGHVPETRRIVLDRDRVENFLLPTTASRILVIRDGATTRIPDDLALLGFETAIEAASLTDPTSWPGYKLVIWSAGANADPVGDATKRAALESFATAGHSLLIEGGQIGYDTFRSPGYPSFGQNVLHCSAWDVSNAGPISIAAGAEGHALVTTPNTLPNQYAIQYVEVGDEDAVRPRTEATLIYKTQSYSSDGGIVVYDDTPSDPSRGQIVYYAFNYDRLTDTANARRLLENTVAYLNRTNPAEAAEAVSVPAFWVSPAYPNPARGDVHFRLRAAPRGKIDVAIYDPQGRKVMTLAGPAEGEQAVSWDGRTGNGAIASTGIYFLRLHGNRTVAGRAFLWIRP